MTTRREEELLALILDPVEGVPVLGLDASGRIVRWTPGVGDALGYGEAELLRRHVSDLYAPEEVARGAPDDDMRTAAEHGHSVRDRWVVRADGSRFWGRTVIRARRDADGALTGFVKLTCDLTDQLDMMRDMAAADQRLAALVELAVDGIVSTDENGLVILFNRGAERMFGYDRHEVVGKPLGMLLSERHRAGHEGHMRAFRAGRLDADRMAHGRVVTALSKDGREFPIEASISRLELDRGAVLSVILRDASERVAVEQGLRESEGRARTLADALPFPIHYLDRNLDHVFGNAAVAAWLGRSVEDLSGLSLREAAYEIGSGATYETFRPELEAALRGEPRRFLGRARDAEGAVRDIEILAVPSRDAVGSVDGCYVVMFDRTEERSGRTGQNVVTAAGRLLGSAVDLEVTVDSVVRLVVASFADDCTAYLGEGEDSWMAFSARGNGDSLLSTEDVPLGAQQAARDGQTRSYTSVEDRDTYVVVPLACVERRGGAMLYRWAAPFDVSHHEVEVAQELGRRLAAAIDRIELTRRSTDAVRARDWVLHKVTHDLGNPVASIVMVADRLLRTSPSPDRRERSRMLLEGIRQQAQEMRLIIEELLDATALRTGRVSISPHAVDVSGILRQAVSLLGPMAEQRLIDLDPELPDGVPRVLADPNHLRHALTALITDQIGWCQSGGIVRARARQAGSEIVFEVSGPGSGLPAEEVASRLEAGRHGGTGPSLSLPLVIGAEIVRAHGATIDVRRGLDGQTIYGFALPAAD